jgi:ankyrin repeat protein
MKVRTATTLLQLGANPNTVSKVRRFLHRFSCIGVLSAYCECAVKAGWTPLLYAVSRGCTPIITALIAANANVNFADKVSSKQARLCWLVWNKRFGCCQCGVTPLMIAAGGDQVDTVTLLLRHGAEVNAVNQVKG